MVDAVHASGWRVSSFESKGLMNEFFRQRRTWLILGEDGSHSWLGRYRDPMPDELNALAAKIDGQNVVPWLAVLRGDYWDVGDTTELLIVRRLTKRDGDLEQARKKWRGRRAVQLKSPD